MITPINVPRYLHTKPGKVPKLAIRNSVGGANSEYRRIVELIKAEGIFCQLHAQWQENQNGKWVIVYERYVTAGYPLNSDYQPIT